MYVSPHDIRIYLQYLFDSGLNHTPAGYSAASECRELIQKPMRESHKLRSNDPA